MAAVIAPTPRRPRPARMPPYLPTRPCAPAPPSHRIPSPVRRAASAPSPAKEAELREPPPPYREHEPRRPPRSPALRSKRARGVQRTRRLESDASAAAAQPDPRPAGKSGLGCESPDSFVKRGWMAVKRMRLRD